MALLKKSPFESPSNYRPISLLICVGKLQERIIFKHVFNFFLTNNLIHRHQSGFLPGHSTVYQLIDLYNQIVQSIDAKQYTCMVFCDVSKSFARVWHKDLLFKLLQNGIIGKLLNWIWSYLSERKQIGFVGSPMSSPRVIKAGVPQGTVLGPLFFLVYIYDIVENLLSIVRLFADDTSLACSSASIRDIESILNYDLLVLSTWRKQWLVDFNLSKTEAIIFSCNDAYQFPNLMFEDVLVNFVESHKQLGLTLSSNAKWHAHIEIITCVSKLLGIMRAVKYKLSRKALINIHISYIRPILEYAAVVWDGCTAAVCVGENRI